VRWRDRPTSDLIVLGFAALIVAIVLAGSISLMIAELRGAHVNADLLAERLGRLVSSLLAAVIGYLAGRGVSNTPKDADGGDG
jgi:Na+/H+ antiporter NhaA